MSKKKIDTSKKIDEAIAYHNGVAKMYRENENQTIVDCFLDKELSAIECAEYHEQLAKWLVELQECKDILMILQSH